MTRFANNAVAAWQQQVYPLCRAADEQRTQGQYPVAAPLYWRALAIFRSSLGATHPKVRTCQDNLARLQQLMAQQKKSAKKIPARDGVFCCTSHTPMRANAAFPGKSFFGNQQRTALICGSDGKEMYMTKIMNDDATAIEITLNVEEIEAVIAPGLDTTNHNETFVRDEVELCVEEIEEVVAPGLIAQNHNETLVADEVELRMEEVEAVIAPKLASNHNEAIVSDEIELEVEEMEEVIAPGLDTQNHNETLEVDLCVEEVEEVIAPGLQTQNHNETLLIG